MIRKAVIRDVIAIKKLIEPHGTSGDMLPVSLSELYDRLRSFFVYEDDKGKIGGTAALHVTWGFHANDPDSLNPQSDGEGPGRNRNEQGKTPAGGLAEIRSLCVDEEHRKRDIGRRLVSACIEDAKTLGVTRIFVLTYIPDFFKKIGFAEVEKSTLPHKVWSHCLKCVHFPDCNEIAMIRDVGEE
jgi:amino-acid N-acetyltransferase